MAIPTGTTTRQMGTLARWGLGAMMVCAGLMWWWPALIGWGLLTGGVLWILTLWLAGGVAGRSTRIPAGLLQPGMLGAMGILFVHAVRLEATASPDGYNAAAALSGSMLLQMFLLVAGMMLVHALLLSRSTWRWLLVGLAGAAAMLGAVTGMVWNETAPLDASLGLMGLAGLAVWLVLAWGYRRDLPGPEDRVEPAPGEVDQPGDRTIRALVAGLGVIPAVMLGLLAPEAAAVAMAASAVAMLLAGVLTARSRRAVLLGGGAALLAGAVAWIHLAGMDADWLAGLPERTTAFGQGGGFLIDGPGLRSGLVMLVGTIGWAGTAAILAPFAAAVVWLLWSARSAGASLAGCAVLSAVAGMLSVLSLLAPGGLYSPAVSAMVMFCGGLVCSELPIARRTVSGWVLLAAMLPSLMVTGLSGSMGLLSWMTRPLGLSDTHTHALAGFFVAFVLGWLMGRRRGLWGLAGIALAALAGGAAEGVQYLLGGRSPQWSDWIAHLAGSAGAAVVYALACGARWAESADAVARRKQRLRTDAYGYTHRWP